MKQWLGYNFNLQGWSRTHENHSDAFDRFVKNLRSKLRKEAKEYNLEVLPFKANWFTTSGFIKNKETGKFAYWCISDVRYFHDEWYYNVLFRTAENEKDYTGGANHFCSMNDLVESVAKITL